MILQLGQIWLSRWRRDPGPNLRDRDVSACLVLGGETLGALICADAGDHLRVMAIIGNEDIPGARRRAIPLLMDHALRSCAGRGYDRVVFRANTDQARQTVKLQRLGGFGFGGGVNGVGK